MRHADARIHRKHKEPSGGRRRAALPSLPLQSHKVAKKMQAERSTKQQPKHARSKKILRELAEQKAEAEAVALVGPKKIRSRSFFWGLLRWQVKG